MKREAPLPWSWLDGRTIRSRHAMVSIFDRSFQLGDGLFETLRVIAGRPIQWTAHWRRFKATAQALEITVPTGGRQLFTAAVQLARRNRVNDAILRFQLSRGVGQRGYSPRGATRPLLVMTLYAAPPLQADVVGRARISLEPLPCAAVQPLLRHKTASRLSNVMLQARCDTSGHDGAVTTDEHGNILEGISSNFFWWHGRTLVTPPESAGILPGTARRTVLRIAARRGIACREALAPVKQVLGGDGAFLTVSTRGITEIARLANRPLPSHPLTGELHRDLVRAWQREAGRRSRTTVIASRRATAIA